MSEIDVLRMESALANEVMRGVPLTVALLTTMRSLTQAGHWPRARALAAGLDAGASPSAAVALGYAASLRQRHLLAAQEWESVPDDDLARWLPWEAVQTLLLAEAERYRERAVRVALLVEGDPTLTIRLAAALAAVHEPDGVRALLARLTTAVESSLSAEDRQSLALVREAVQHVKPAIPDDAVVLGCLDYLQPDLSRASKNVGDYVQSLAMLGNLCRFENVTITGEQGLGDVASSCQRDIPEHLREAGLRGRVHLVPVHRDFSTGQHLPQPTWTVAFGWYLHPAAAMGYDFPFHPNVRPIFVSFHISQPEMLTAEAVAYLRAYGPVGCRDWTTVYLLLSEGVDAFFSGCLTTTVDAVVPPGSPREAPRAVGLVDLPEQARARITGATVTVTNVDRALRLGTAASGLDAARRMLRRYRTEFASLETSRLHAYLPATSLGLPTTFRPRNRADVRFSGLLGLEPDSQAFVTMRDELRDLMRLMLSTIIAGASEPEVYRVWREHVTPMVAAARARHAAVRPHPVAATDVEPGAAKVRASALSWGAHRDGPLEVIVSATRARAERVAVTLDSVVSHARTPVHVTVLTRGLGEEYGQWLSGAVGDCSITQMRCDALADAVPGAGRRRHPAGADEVLAPVLLPGVGRALYLTPSMLVLQDPCDLRDVDLSESPVAARPSVQPGFRYWWRAANKLGPQDADEMRKAMTQFPTVQVPHLDAGVLVLDLERLRRESFVSRGLGWAQAYGFSFADALMTHANGQYTPLDQQWNAWPMLERVNHPAIVRVAAGAPAHLVTPFAQEWGRHLTRVRDRAGQWRGGG